MYARLRRCLILIALRFESDRGRGHACAARSRLDARRGGNRVLGVASICFPFFLDFSRLHRLGEGCHRARRRLEPSTELHTTGTRFQCLGHGCPPCSPPPPPPPHNSTLAHGVTASPLARYTRSNGAPAASPDQHECPLGRHVDQSTGLARRVSAPHHPAERPLLGFVLPDESGSGGTRRRHADSPARGAPVRLTVHRQRRGGGTLPGPEGVAPPQLEPEQHGELDRRRTRRRRRRRRGRLDRRRGGSRPASESRSTLPASLSSLLCRGYADLP